MLLAKYFLFTYIYIYIYIYIRIYIAKYILIHFIAVINVFYLNLFIRFLNNNVLYYIMSFETISLFYINVL